MFKNEVHGGRRPRSRLLSLTGSVSLPPYILSHPHPFTKPFGHIALIGLEMRKMFVHLCQAWQFML